MNNIRLLMIHLAISIAMAALSVTVLYAADSILIENMAFKTGQSHGISE